MVQYPGAIKTFTSKTNKVDLVDASHINDLQEEVNAIETELGTDVAGSATDLKTRLAVCLADSGVIRNGSSFPGSPPEGMVFYRSDEQKFYGRASASWKDFTQGAFSNVLFSFTLAAGVRTIYKGTGLVPSTGNEYAFWGMSTNSSSYETVIPVFKWTKISTVSTVTIHAKIWQNNNTGDADDKANLKVDIGGQSGNVSGSEDRVTPEYVTFTIDVSGLSNGTNYDVTIQLKHMKSGGPGFSYLESIIAIGS